MAKRSRTKRRAANPSRVVGRPESSASIGSVYGVRSALPHLQPYQAPASRPRLYTPPPVASHGPGAYPNRNHERSVNRSAVKLHTPKVELFSEGKSADPTVCAARQTRKEVIHALGKAGGGDRKPATFTPTSKQRC